MKKLLFAFVLLSGTLTAQTVKAKYTKNHLKDQVKAVFTGGMNTTDTYTQKSETPPSTYTYVYCNNKSLLTMTSDGGHSKTSDPSKNLTVISPSHLVYYKDFTGKLIRTESITNNNPESTSSGFRDYEWKITKEKAVIAGHKCTKAIGKINDLEITAWFAKDIKVSDGPLGLTGLPGLMLKVAISDLVEITASDVVASKEPVTIIEPEAKAPIQVQ